MRLFVALELAPEACRAAEEVARELKATGADVKWVRPESLHLTLKFLGEVDPGRLPELQEALRRACAGARALELGLAGAGAFPGVRRPQVVWLGLEGQTAELAGLAARVEDEAEALGFARDKRGFKPHLTLGRMRRKRRGAGAPPAGPLARALAGLAGWQGPRFTGSRVSLMHSTLTPAGAVYEPLETVTLT
jgi:2'-5' RNA ligase